MKSKSIQSAKTSSAQRQLDKSPLSKIEESESEISEQDSEVNSSSDNNARQDQTRQSVNKRLRDKADKLREQRTIDKFTKSEDNDQDIPSNNLIVPEPKKKSSLLLRIVSSTTLISFQCLCYAAGHLYYSLLLLFCGFKCYWELIEINRNPVKDGKNKLVRTIEWYFPLTFAFFLLPKTFIRRILIDNDSVIDFKKSTPIMYDVFFIDHNLFCCMLFMIGLIIFTLSLRKGQYKYQFQRLGWITLSAVLPISASLFFGYYVYKGYFWMVVTNGSVMINDIMAFVFGKTFGKTPLIKLSPNKTVEGFVGGGISTIIFAIWITGKISHYQQITCPANELTLYPFMALKCERPHIYDPQVYDLPFTLGPLSQIKLSAAQIHAGVIALFAAVVAPFGGFFASGLKRGLKIKDFSDSIPGHGGVADRFDCHIVISVFTFVYLTQIVYKDDYGVERIFDFINKLSEKEKQNIYLKLHSIYQNSTVV